MLKYDAHNYDDFLKLKISGSLWFSIFYGIRHFVLFVGIKLMADNFGLVDWVNVQVNYFFILADIPAVLVLLCTGHRLPEALPVMRWIWTHGKFMLITSYILGIIIFIYLNNDLIQYENLNKLILALSVLMPDILIISFILKSELIKDIFSEFPSQLNK